MRLRLAFPFVALLALAACDGRPASKTEIAARTPIPTAVAPACPPQAAAPACPPAAGKFPAKPSGASAAHRARSGHVVRQVAYRHPVRRHSARNDGWTDGQSYRRYDDRAAVGPGYPYRRYEDAGVDRDTYRDDRGPEPRDGYDRYRRSTERDDSYSREESYGRDNRERYARPDDQDRRGEYAPQRYGADRRGSDGYGPDRYGPGPHDRDARARAYRGEQRYSRSDERYEQGEARTSRDDYDRDASGYRARAESRESYSASESSSYSEQRSDDEACCRGASTGVAGYDGFGYLTWPGKTPERR